MQPFPIQIQVYEDKLVIWNIGEMPKSVGVKMLYKTHHSVPRNPNLANIFFKCGAVESWGRGYRNIEKICQESNSKLPVPEENSEGLQVICLASSEYLAQVPNNCPKVAEQTYLAICKNPKASNKDLQAILSLSARAVGKHIAMLKKAGLIERIGSNKNGYWKITESNKISFRL